MVTGETFVGFDPTRGAEQFDFCPRFGEGATLVWFEKWAFTGWTSHGKINTGIVYQHCYGTFDITGNLISTQSICGPPCGGFTGNYTGSKDRPPPTPEAWLAEARSRLAYLDLKPPGTIEQCAKIGAYIGIPLALDAAGNAQ